MEIKEYTRQDTGWFACAICRFITPHESKIQRHMVKSHGREPYPAPPVLAAKWRKYWPLKDGENGDVN